MSYGDAAVPGPLVVFDADSTLIDEEAIELLAAAVGSHDRVADITERAMRGELDFAASLRERVATLRGLPVAAFDTVRARMTATRGALELIAAIHARGGRAGVVSGGFHELLDPLADRLGLDFCRANRLEVADGRLTGAIHGPIVDAATKAATLREWAVAAGIPHPRTVAVGDGANDLHMLAAAGLGVAFCAKPVLRAAADIVLDTRDLAQLAALL